MEVRSLGSGNHQTIETRYTITATTIREWPGATIKTLPDIQSISTSQSKSQGLNFQSGTRIRSVERKKYTLSWYMLWFVKLDCEPRVDYIFLEVHTQ